MSSPIMSDLEAKATVESALQEINLRRDEAVFTNGTTDEEASVKTGLSVAHRQFPDAMVDEDLIDTGTVPTETSYVLFFQVLFPFFVAGFGMVLAGIVLDVVQHWPLFAQVPEIFILVPALLGLKGNLEMTLASRLSTLAIVVAFLASAFAIILAWIPRGHVDWAHASLLCASSVTTASLASLVLSIVMISVVLLSRRYNINPDNVATPIAASLGDLTTLAVLSLSGSYFLKAHLTESWLNVIVILVFLSIAPFWAYAASRDSTALDVLENGWTPVVFRVGGNLAAVHASRISTFFHKTSPIGALPFKWELNRFRSFNRAFFSSEWDARSARVLIFLIVPGHMTFNWLIRVLHPGEALSSPLFTSLYLAAALTQVTVLLYVCQWLVAAMWKYEIDPDNAAIPYLTALGDLLGTILLTAALVSLHYINEEEFA
uniref:MgtE domain-containing protein n=1 Tax=Steinernema glaseri TaxID=37863 RepID=A0A1I7YDK4_9BILA